jgi:hypothetical protein
MNNNIHEQFQAFVIVIVSNVDSVKLCKLFSIFNNLNIVKNSILSYKENLQHAWKIWIEFDWLNLELT